MRLSSNQSGRESRTLFPVVLILGDVERAEMRPVVAWLDEFFSSSARPVSVRAFVNVPDELARDEFPDLIVVLQSWSNEYSTADVNRLLASAPLARVVVCYGAWCESDGRNHNVWPLSIRVPVWAAVSRIEREWRLIQNPDERMPLPWSASREEVFADDHPHVPIGLRLSSFADSCWEIQTKTPHPNPLPAKPGRGDKAEQNLDLERDVELRRDVDLGLNNDSQSVRIDSPDSAYRQFLGEMLVAVGHVLESVTPEILLFDADPWGPIRSHALQSLRAQHPSAVVAVLISLAEPSIVAEFRQSGIANVIHKLGFRQAPTSLPSVQEMAPSVPFCRD